MLSTKVLQGVWGYGKEANDFEGKGRGVLLRNLSMPWRGNFCKDDGASRFSFNAEAGKWARNSSSKNVSISGHLVPGFDCDAEFSVVKISDTFRGSAATVNTGAAANSWGSSEMQDDCCFKVVQSPTVPAGGLHLGLCGNALIMRVGSDTRCFHHQLLCSKLAYFEEHAYSNNTAHATDAKVLGLSGSTIVEGVPVVKGRRGLTLVQGKPVITRSQVDSNRVLQNKRGKTSLTRDLYEKSHFHLFEALFCFRHPDSKAVAAKFQVLSKKNVKELVNVLNQAAIGLAGVGATCMLFVASRVLWLDMFLSSQTILSLAIGGGFLWLSWAVKRVSEVLICLGNYSRSRTFPEAYMNTLRKELRRISLGALLVVVLCAMNRGSLL